CETEFGQFKFCDALDSVSNCGACNNACPDGASCVEGACVCPGDQVDCNGECTDIASSFVHCGGCNQLCSCDLDIFPLRVGCENGSCQMVESPDGRVAYCDGVCVDLVTDPNHCGACGNVCEDDAICVNGECGCGDGERSCGEECCPDGQLCCGGVCCDA